MKKRILLCLYCLAMTAMVIFSNTLTSNAGNYVCAAGLHVMTNAYNQTYVTTYKHASQYGTCSVRIEEVKKITKCQCGMLMTQETCSKREVHSQPH